MSRSFARGLFFVVLLAVASVPAFAGDEMIVSRLGGKCLDAEGGAREGARLIAYTCSGAPNQKWSFQDERLRVMQMSLCAQADSPNPGSEIHLRNCIWGYPNQAAKLQNFAQWSQGRIGHNSGNCLDLAGGGWGQFFSWASGGNQPAILYGCHGGDNQKWYGGALRWVSGATSIPSGMKFSVPGRMGYLEKRSDGNFYDVASGRIVAAGAGNIVAAGGGNIVAAGGGNIVAAGAGN